MGLKLVLVNKTSLTQAAELFEASGLLPWDSGPEGVLSLGSPKKVMK